MLAQTLSATPWGIDARVVHVEVDAHNGLPQTHIVGLPDAAVRESRERVRSAIKNCGFQLPPKAIIVNLAPADLRKEGNHLDLAIAIAWLAALGEIPEDALTGRILCGELGLDGAIRPVRGGLAIADLAHRLGAREVLLPVANAAEAAALRTVPILAAPSLAAVVEHLLGTTPLAVVSADDPTPAESANWELSLDPGGPTAEALLGPAEDLADVRGQHAARRALEVAAAGGHNLLLVGPPGSGKTMLARRLPGLLPTLSTAEAVAVTKVYSIAADRPPNGLVQRRPFRAPHSGISTAGLIGGGSLPRPGEASLAHGGVLFLDELPEFKRDALEALRQPLEDGSVTVVRTRARVTFPARFALVAAMNPCPCGHLGDPRGRCVCPPHRIEAYRSRISGPLLDRIDLHVEVPAVHLEDLRGPRGESSSTVANRVANARQRQRQRFPKNCPTPFNAALGPQDLQQACKLQPDAQHLLDRAFHHLGLSARGLHRILKVSRTLADLQGAEDIASAHVAEAIQYRALDRRVE